MFAAKMPVWLGLVWLIVWLVPSLIIIWKERPAWAFPMLLGHLAVIWLWALVIKPALGSHAGPLGGVALIGTSVLIVANATAVAAFWRWLMR